ncbi:uncharacterized protein LOC121874917 [Homarus americanus]|uniref:uncharacterized protein LOC121874917 n=1 Tax=Homarus americanus TaxID=6706 RepID=UPI001C49077A|nr:uncharacterized protein LOC121874917 [Homarus americanus]
MIDSSGTKMMVVVAVLAVVKSTVHSATCDNIKVLAKCDKDEGPKEPVDGQVVYLGHENGDGYWVYPRFSGYVWNWEYPTKDITDPEAEWAKWIWHDCGTDLVCLESVKYPNNYLYTHNFVGYSYSSSPKTEDWTKLKISQKSYTSRGIHMFLSDQRWIDDGYDQGIYVYVYIPPRCFGYKIADELYNYHNDKAELKYEYSRGLTRSDKKTITVTLESKISVGTEVTNGIISAALSIENSLTTSWAHETLASETTLQKTTTTVNVQPNTKLVVWQKVATYGPYEWYSSSARFLCSEPV